MQERRAKEAARINHIWLMRGEKENRRFSKIMRREEFWWTSSMDQEL